MKIDIGGCAFATKAAAKKHATQVLTKYKGRRIDVGAEDYGFIAALWKRSPSWAEGYTKFDVGQKFNGLGITAVGDGGKSIDWSIKTAVSGRNVNMWSMLTQAMRGAIRPQILAFRGRSVVHCELCSSTRQIEVDHVVTFKVLMYQWLELWGDERPSDFVYSHAGFQFREEDEAFRRGWANHHRVHCRLRFLCSDCHVKVTTEARQSSGSEGSEGEVEEEEAHPRD